MIILFSKQVLIVGKVTEAEFNNFAAYVSCSVKKWNDDGKPNSGDFS
jgi:hypothetical protein